MFDLIVSEPTLEIIASAADLIGAEEFHRLIPDDEEERGCDYANTPEFRLLDARGNALTAQLFAAVAAAPPGWAAERAGYFRRAHRLV